MRRAVTRDISPTPATCVFDKDLRFVSLNARCEEIFGRRAEDLVGRLHSEAYPDAVGQAPRDAMLRALKTLRPVRDVVWSVPLNCWLEVVIHPVRAGVQVTFDVVEQPTAEGAAS